VDYKRKLYKLKAWLRSKGEGQLMDWLYYKTLLEQKIKDAEHNHDYALKQARETKAILESVLREKESFLKMLEGEGK
jgi:hypothetical protein